MPGAEGEIRSRERLGCVFHTWEHAATYTTHPWMAGFPAGNHSYHPTASHAGWCSQTPTAASCTCRAAKHTVAISCTNTAALKTHSCYLLSASCEIQHNSSPLLRPGNQHIPCRRYAECWGMSSCPSVHLCTQNPATPFGCSSETTTLL